MSKQEFIDKLRLALSGRVSASLVEENVAYYEEYINTQIRLGYNEASILNGLGDPRLIAKSIITANNGNAAENPEDFSKERYYDEGTREYMTNRKSNYPKVVRIPGWVWLLIVIIVLVLVISAVFSLISFLLPILLPILVVLFFIKLFRDWLN